MKPTFPAPKRAYHTPTLTKHGSVEELTLTFGYYNPGNWYGHIHSHGCGHGNMPGS
jgi:hypothetical protein